MAPYNGRPKMVPLIKWVEKKYGFTKYHFSQIITIIIWIKTNKITKQTNIRTKQINKQEKENMLTNIIQINNYTNKNNK